MASALRRNPITIALGVVLALGFLVFIFGGSSTPAPTARRSQVPSTKPSKPPPIEHVNMNPMAATKNAAANKQEVLILTPLSKFYDGYWKNLNAFTYPHELIELGFIVPRGKEGNAVLAEVEEAVKKVQSGPKNKRFKKVHILRDDHDMPVGRDEKERHALSAQKARRGSMALSRNSLLFSTISPTTAWVFWLDGDIVETPATILEDMTGHDKPILTANCYQRYEGGVRPYDYNNWHESQTALNLAASMSEDDILVEGYRELPTYRSLFVYEYNEHGNKNTETELDGVGGTALLVKAEVHRDGAMFPSFPFYHLIETEGFAKMAKRLGYQAWGLPNYLVYHYNE
ncbi:Golgi mannosyltransferase complex subunit [Saitoella coloradoensis]